MSQRWQVIGVILAVLMGATALGMEIQQRLAHLPAPPTKARPVAPAPVTGEERKGLTPFPVPKGGMEVAAKNGKAPTMDGWMNGTKQYQLTAQRLVLTPGQRSTVAETISGVGVAGANGKPTIRFTAERAIMNTDTRDLEVQGHVRVESLDPKRHVVFETDGMRWLAREERLECSNPVQVEQEGVLLRARRMTADIRLKKLTLDQSIYLEAEADQVKKTLGVTEQGGRKGGR